METREIIQALPGLSANDCLKIAEVALELINQERKSLTKDEQKRLLAAAARTAIEDYTPGSELIVFSDIEGEDFYEYPDQNL
ncbi:MAG: hypothetical protein KME64_14035 [Scytonematopsis contorta HA4267-MV1]|jgi:hypothetical protein|nr:hypothetical protein [Scytonematopsis contorta HA4267-MV1]